jgi:hypothetical protein
MNPARSRTSPFANAELRSFSDLLVPFIRRALESPVFRYVNPRPSPQTIIDKDHRRILSAWNMSYGHGTGHLSNSRYTTASSAKAHM